MSSHHRSSHSISNTPQHVVVRNEVAPLLLSVATRNNYIVSTLSLKKWSAHSLTGNPRELAFVLAGEVQLHSTRSSYMVVSISL